MYVNSSNRLPQIVWVPISALLLGFFAYSLPAGYAHTLLSHMSSVTLIPLIIVVKVVHSYTEFITLQLVRHM